MGLPEKECGERRICGASWREPLVFSQGGVWPSEVTAVQHELPSFTELVHDAPNSKNTTVGAPVPLWSVQIFLTDDFEGGGLLFAGHPQVAMH